MILGRETKLSFLLYKYLFHSNNTVSKWISKVKSTLSVIGRPDIWRQQHAIYLKSLTVTQRNYLLNSLYKVGEGKLYSHIKHLLILTSNKSCVKSTILSLFLVSFISSFLRYEQVTTNYQLK